MAQRTQSSLISLTKKSSLISAADLRRFSRIKQKYKRIVCELRFVSGFTFSQNKKPVFSRSAPNPRPISLSLTSAPRTSTTIDQFVCHKIHNPLAIFYACRFCNHEIFSKCFFKKFLRILRKNILSRRK